MFKFMMTLALGKLIFIYKLKTQNFRRQTKYPHNIMSLTNYMSKYCLSSLLLRVSQAGKCQLMSSPVCAFQTNGASSCSKPQSHRSCNNLRKSGAEGNAWSSQENQKLGWMVSSCKLCCLQHNTYILQWLHRKCSMNTYRNLRPRSPDPADVTE